MSKSHEVTAWIDLNIIDKPWGKSLTKEFDEKKSKYLIESMPVPNTIAWSISNLANNIDEEFVSQLLLLMTTEQFFQFVSVCRSNKTNMSDLFQTINSKYNSKKSITIVIIGVSSSLILSKNLPRSLAIKSSDLDSIYLDLQLQFNCIIKYAENDHDLATLILSFTKAVTVAPEKRLKNMSPFSFHVDAMKQYKPIRVDIDQANKTLEQLWKQILQQFPHMGIEQAQAIVNQYGSVQALVQAYRQCASESQAKLLLADIQVRRGAGVLTTTRKIGPQMSEKIWKLFTSNDGNDHNCEIMFLVVFDFDHTIIDDNSDIHINKLFPSDDARTTAEKARSQFVCWTDRMQESFRQLHQFNIKQQDYIENMQQIPLTSGFAHLIQYLYSLPNSHIIIASDSNLVFINTILKYHQLDHAFKDIFTNPAYFSQENGCLMIEQYGQQTCPTCPSNMCKREIIEKYLHAKFPSNTRVLFIGDGHNDVCAAVNLKKGDLVCARSGYRMAKELKQQETSKLQAELFEWTDGKQIEDFIKENWLK